jgi:hypothetical protein
MKTASLLLSFFLLTINIYSQQEGYPEPVRAGKHFLVNSAGLPEELLLFSPDTATQILFNAARANDFSKSFIFVNYLSDYAYSYVYPIYYMEEYPITLNKEGGLYKSADFNFPQIYEENYTTSKNPTFSAAGLINTGNAKWLFELSNGINTGTSSQDYRSTQTTVIDPAVNYYSSNNKDNQENHTDGTITSFKISRIFKANQLNMSAGLYGVVMTNKSNSAVKHFTEHYSFQDPTPTDSLNYRLYSLQGETINFDDTETRYVVGFEYTAGNDLFDYVGSIDYQFGDNSYNNIDNLDSYSYDSTRYSPSQPWNTRRTEQFTNTRQNSSHKPSVLNFSSYFRHKLGLIGSDDNIFISANAFYASGTVSYNSFDERISLSYTETGTAGDTVNIENSNKYDVNDWGLTFSAGYVFPKTIDDLSFLTGLKILGSIEHLDGLRRYRPSSYQSGFMEYAFKPSMFSVTLPVYVNYSPADWVSVYAGLNYSYAYTYEKSNQSMDNIFRESYSPTETTFNLRYDESNHMWQSYKSFYFGCEFRHPAGLRAQFFFDRDITNVPDWNVSLGWVF